MQAYSQTPDTTPFTLPPSWSSALDACTSPSSPSSLHDAQVDLGYVYLVKGPKNTGKSTFARTLMNRLLETYERVAYLECDLGQSEFTPGGMVALSVVERPVFGAFSLPLIPRSLSPMPLPCPPLLLLLLPSFLPSFPPFLPSLPPSFPPFLHPFRSKNMKADVTPLDIRPPPTSPTQPLPILRTLTSGLQLPASSPSYYLSAVQSLLQFYRLEVQTPSDLPSSSWHSEEDIGDEEDMDDDDGERRAGDGEREGQDGTQRRCMRRTRRVKDVVPLIVNTMGWSKGLGADLTQKIEEWALPTDVFTFDPPPPPPPPLPFHSGVSSPPIPIRRGSNYQSFGAFDGGRRGMGCWMGTYTAADHRTLTLLSYFHAIFPSPSPSSLHFPSLPHSPPHVHSASTSTSFTPSPSTSLLDPHALGLRQLTATHWNTALPLVAIPPYNVDASKALDAVVLVGAGAEDVVEGEVGRVLNGALVGLVSCSEGAFVFDGEGNDGAEKGDGRSKGRRLPYTQGRPPPDPSTSSCVGLALVRAVHPRYIDGPSPPGVRDDVGAPGEGEERGEAGRVDLQILTPVPPEMLSSTRVLVKGEMELPVWGMLDFRAWDSSSTSSPSFVASADSEEGGGGNARDGRGDET
ncbi:hypothetical protein NMY22_g19822 [Coprinellus aureogranulatus]|nr:hypothetical protein NMY22_g19822 [Coprinellus aureogranulatus]